jgi:hypothetical protein
MNGFRNIALAVPALILAFLIALAHAPAAAWAKGALPGEFQGKFRGAVTAPGNSSGKFTVAIESREDGFTVRWPPRIVVDFEPASRPGVFRDSKKSKPMAGDPVYWARIDSGRLIVYSMQLDEQGGYNIGSYIYTPASSGLELTIRRVKAGGAPVEFSGELERYGG